MTTKSADSPVLEAYNEFKRYAADPEMIELERRRQENMLELKLRMSEAYFDGKADVARNLKAKGFELSQIAEVTGFSEWEIENFPERSPH